MVDIPRIEFEDDKIVVMRVSVNDEEDLVFENVTGSGVVVENLLDGNRDPIAVNRRKKAFLAHVATTNNTSASGNTWNTLPYNSVEFNGISTATFDTNTHQLTLQPGSYYFDIFHNAYNTNDTNIRLYDPVNNTELKQGSMAYGAESAPMTIKWKTTFASQITIEMQIRPRQSTSYAAGVVRDDNVPTSQTPFAGDFYVEEL